jgi:hypothetical protein
MTGQRGRPRVLTGTKQDEREVMEALASMKTEQTKRERDMLACSRQHRTARSLKLVELDQVHRSPPTSSP